MKILLTIALLAFVYAPSYAGFNTSGDRGSNKGGYNSGSGHKTDTMNRGYKTDTRNDFYENDIDNSADALHNIKPKANNTSNVTPVAATAASTKAAEIKPTTAAPTTNSDAGKKIQKVTRGNVVTYEWASPQQANQVIAEADTQVEIITVAAAPKPDNTFGFSSASQTKKSQWASQFTMFPQDENGWSIIKPQVDSRIIFVSSSEGNDSKAQAYFSKDIDNPHNPSKKIVAFKTIREALKLVRAGYSDWILLKKGDVWQLEQPISLPSGKSSYAPLLITSYGVSNNRPLIKTGVNAGISLINSKSFIAVIGIEFYANQRNPDSIDFVGWANIGRSVAFRSITNDTKDVQSIYLEDNVFNYFTNNLVFDGGLKHSNIIIRRNQILNSYSINSHSQGIYASKSSMLLEENLFDHNGWYQQNYEQLNSASKGQATFYNHNAYLANMKDTVITGNIFARASSIGIKLAANADKDKKINSIKAKNIVIKDNLFVEGEIGISAGGNRDFNNGYRWENISIIDNVMLHVGNSQPTRRGLAWHIDVQDWDGGLVSNNHLLFNDNTNVGNVFGIQVSGFSRNVDVTKNTLRGLGGNSDRMVYQVDNETLQNINMSQNSVNMNAVTKMNRRDLTSYLNVSDGSNGVARLVEKAKMQSKEYWNKTYTASEINEYLMK